MLILIICGSGSGKANVLLNLIKHERVDIDKKFYMSKIHLNQSINFFISGKEKGRNQKIKNPKVFVDYSRTVDDLEGHNS